MKKWIFVLLVVLLAGCGGSSDSPAGHWEAVDSVGFSWDLLPGGDFVLIPGFGDLTMRGRWETKGAELCLHHDTGISECHPYEIDGDYLVLNVEPEPVVLRRTE